MERKEKNYQVINAEKTSDINVLNESCDCEEETCECILDQEKFKNQLATILMYIVSLIAASSIFGLILYSVYSSSYNIAAHSFMIASIIIGVAVLGIFGAIVGYVKSRIGVK